MDIRGTNTDSPYRNHRANSFGSSDDDAARYEMAQMAMNLRRMKRQLLLRTVEDNQKPVDSLRDLLWKAAQTPPGSPRECRTVKSPPELPSQVLE